MEIKPDSFFVLSLPSHLIYFLFYITVKFFVCRFIWKSYVNFSFTEFIFVMVKDAYLVTFHARMANYVNLLHILHWFWKKSTGWYYKGVSRTTTRHKVEHCMKNDKIQAFSNPYFPVFGQNWRFCWFCPNTGKYRYDFAHIWENMDSRKSVFGHISLKRTLCDIS